MQIESRFEALTRSIARFSAEDSMAGLCEAIVDETIHHLGFDRCGVFLYDAATDTKKGMWGTDPEGRLVNEQGTVAPVYERERLASFDQGTVRILNHTPLFHQDRQIGEGELIECIILDQGGVLGWLFIDNFISKRPISHADESFVELFGSIVGQLIIRQRHHEILAQRNQQLSNALSDLEKAQQSLVQTAKMASLGNIVVGMAHELNTPLGTAIMAGSLLDHKVRTMVPVETLDAEWHDSHQLLMNSLQRSASLVREFKDLSYSGPEESFTEICLPDFLRHCVRKCADADSMKREVELHLDVIDSASQVALPQLTFERIIDELLANVFNHAYENEPVRLWISAGRQSDGQLAMTIEDAGCGLPDSERLSLFDPFYTGNRQKGPGLGASIAFNLVVSQLRGQLDAYPAIHGGLGVRLSFPLGDASAED